MFPRNPATATTASVNAGVLEALPFDDETDFDDARRGLIAEGSGQITDADGRVVWDIDRWSFLEGDAPDSANPSLWRQGKLASIAGLFRVTEGVYQVRGYDLSVTSFLRTDSGWIVVDPLISVEPMEAAFALVRSHVEDLPVVGIIYTHSHVDHFGGVRGVVSDEDVAAGRVRIVAPLDFMEESVSENVMVGNAMSRRASYMYGNLVGWDPQGGLGAGLGQLTSSGRVTLIPPTDIVSETGQELTIDGLRIVFQHTPDAEAPAEMCFYLPDRNALCMAEIATHNLHNVYTLRGPARRDPAPGQPRVHVHRDRGDDRTPRRHRGPFREPRLLRVGEPLRQGDLRLLPGVVRREPGEPPPASSRRDRGEDRRIHGRGRCRAREGAGGLRQG
jgi:alkyl sulfatase BDS1-like metallo-beta-lactamase superfamily hydrolase